MFQARMLEEMDEEFGIGNLVEEEFKQDKTKVCTIIDIHTQVSFSHKVLNIVLDLAVFFSGVIFMPPQHLRCGGI
jgi:hypothetical protein